MKVTVCQLSNDPDALEVEWLSLAKHVQIEGSDLVLLPEMPFYRWLAASRNVVPEEWQKAVRAHDRWASRLHELGAPAVVATRPVIDGGEHFNEALLWSAEIGIEQVPHRKQYLPEEEGFWEASWYSAVVSGAFCLSSNFSGDGPCGEWGGAGWIVEPEEGEVLATTSSTRPFATVEIDLAVADLAKSTYPRYVADL